MTQAKSNNKLYLFTTLSIYVGLVLVGGAPEVLAGSKLAQNLQNPSFELNTRTELVTSKIKLRKRVETDQILPHAFPGSSVFEYPGARITISFVEQSQRADEVRFSNNQVFTPKLFPRASL